MSCFLPLSSITFFSRICFCTADREHGRVFAFIARNKENETMECRAFLCRKRKMVSPFFAPTLQRRNLEPDVIEVSKCHGAIGVNKFVVMVGDASLLLQAQGVTLAVAESFRMAKEFCEVEEERTKMMRQPVSEMVILMMMMMLVIAIVRKWGWCW